MTTTQLRAGLMVAMRCKRELGPAEREYMQAVIDAALVVLRAQAAASEPVSAPGLLRVLSRPAFAPTGHYARDFPATSPLELAR